MSNRGNATVGGHISQEQADEYAIGSLEPEMERLITLHAADCAQCREVLFEAERIAGMLPVSAPLHRAPAHLKKRIEVKAGVRRPGLIHTVVRYTQAAAGIAAVFIAVAALTGMLSMRSQVNSLKRDNATLEKSIRDVASQEVEIFALSTRLSDAERKANEFEASAEKDRELLSAMLSPDSNVADVVPMANAGGSIGRLVWDEDQKRLWFVARKLPQLDNGQTYQFWVQSSGEWISLGTFNSDENGTATYVRDVPQGISGYDSAIVTIETIGGSPEREGDSVFYVTNLPRP